MKTKHQQKNQLPAVDSPIAWGNLAGRLQDAWHYAALVAPMDFESAFVGDRSLAGLKGKCLAYDELIAKLESLCFDCFPAITGLTIVESSYIQTVAQMEQLIEQRYRPALLAIAQANWIDPYSGERVNKS